MATTGDGATSEGEFWESLNVACLEKIPLLYLVEDNGWAISVPVERQTAGGNIARAVAGFPGLKIFECDGTDFIASYATMSEAADFCRRERSPVLVHATCTRPYSHSLSDDERLYKTASERASEAERDPVKLFSEWLVLEGDPRHPRHRDDRQRNRQGDSGDHGARVESHAPSAGFRAEVPLFPHRRSLL
ncbi:MAG: thiamine pyrophosphate-dependent enzyme [Acidobacteriota bacterium]